MKFLQKDIDQFKVNVTQIKVQKRFIYREKRKAWNRGKQNPMQFTLTEGLEMTDKG